MSVAVVTGAARGIGAAIVRRLVADGWQVVAVDVADGDTTLGYPLAGRADLDAVVEAGGDAVVPVVADVRDRAAVQAAVDTAVERFGGLDAAVAAAGVIAGGAPAWQADDAVYDALVDVNLRGVWHLAAAAVPALLARPEPRQGRFVAVASSAGHRGLPRLALYSAAKHGCVGLVRGLAADLRGTGVTANAVSPGSTDTAMLARSAEVYDLPDPAAFAGQALLERLLAPSEIADVVGWLVSPASSALTGAVVRADGGLTT